MEFIFGSASSNNKSKMASLSSDDPLLNEKLIKPQKSDTVNTPIENQTPLPLTIKKYIEDHKTEAMLLSDGLGCWYLYHHTLTRFYKDIKGQNKAISSYMGYFDPNMEKLTLYMENGTQVNMTIVDNGICVIIADNERGPYYSCEKVSWIKPLKLGLDDPYPYPL
jgi:hypothetical protein